MPRLITSCRADNRSLEPTITNITAVHAAAKCGDTVTIKFTASETLSGNPTVTVNGNAVSNLSHTGNDYTCTYTVGDRNHDPAGEATIHISGYDLDGNFGEVTDTEALWIVDCSQCGNGGFTYDRNGNRKTMCDSRGLTVYFYDAMNRLVKVIEPDEKWIAYEYDAAGNRTKMTTHSDGTPSFHHVTQYEYNNRGLLSKVIDQLGGETTYTYKANGLVDTITYPNGTKAVHTYNDRNWLVSISNRKSDDTIIAEFTYSYDPTYWGRNGTRTRVVENILKPDGNRISAQVDYEYDDLYRLVREHRTPYNGGDAGVVYDKYYVYDAAGNRLSLETKDEQGNRLTYIEYTYDAANKMLTAGNSTFTYDDKGNTLTETNGNVTTTYTWDYLNRLTQWTKTGETTIDFLYNAEGMRVRKIPSGGTQQDFLLDIIDIAEEIVGNDVTSYTGLDDVSKIAGTVWTIYHTDGLGSTRATSNSNEVVQEAVIHDAFGNTLSQSTTGNYGYVGKFRYYTDSETGLAYLKARYYSSSLGRFISRDPLGYGDGLNMYVYVNNNPVVGIDPEGLACELLFKVPTWRSTRVLSSRRDPGQWQFGFRREGGPTITDPITGMLPTTVRCWIRRTIKITDAMRTTVSWWGAFLCYDPCGNFWTQTSKWDVDTDWRRTRTENEEVVWSFQTWLPMPDPVQGSLVYTLKCQQSAPKGLIP